jgi:Arc/MetJ family transcription regulator
MLPVDKHLSVYIMCKNRGCNMATNLAIDEELLRMALEISGLRTKKDIVNLALKEFVNRRKQMEIIDLFGKIDPDPDYDYKKGRIR